MVKILSGFHFLQSQFSWQIIYILSTKGKNIFYFWYTYNIYRLKYLNKKIKEL